MGALGSAGDRPEARDGTTSISRGGAVRPKARERATRVSARRVGLQEQGVRGVDGHAQWGVREMGAAANAKWGGQTAARRHKTCDGGDIFKREMRKT
jgi:hypothetical protein